MNAKFHLPKRKIAEFCKKWNIIEFAVFGSLLRSDFHAESDIDVLVTLNEDANQTLFHLAQMKRELEQILEREVDIVTRRGIESSRNQIRRNEILNSARTVYAS